MTKEEFTVCCSPCNKKNTVLPDDVIFLIVASACKSRVLISLWYKHLLLQAWHLALWAPNRIRFYISSASRFSGRRHVYRLTWKYEECMNKRRDLNAGYKVLHMYPH